MVGQLGFQRGLQHLPRQPGEQPVRTGQLDALRVRLRDQLLREGGQIHLRFDELTGPSVHGRDALQLLAHARFSSRRNPRSRQSRRAIYTKFPTDPRAAATEV